jgi:hypothetical protein
VVPTDRDSGVDRPVRASGGAAHARVESRNGAPGPGEPEVSSGDGHGRGYRRRKCGSDANGAPARVNARLSDLEALCPLRAGTSTAQCRSGAWRLPAYASQKPATSPAYAGSCATTAGTIWCQRASPIVRRPSPVALPKSRVTRTMSSPG